MEYTYHLRDHVKSSDAGIAFIVWTDYSTGNEYEAVAGDDGKQWTLTVPIGNEINKYSFDVICSSAYAECTPYSDITQSEEDPLKFTIVVHAEDGSTEAYTLTIVYGNA